VSARADRTVADRQLVGAVHGARSATRTAVPRSTARTATIPAQRGAPSIERGRATGRAYARREDRLRKLVGGRAPRTAPTAGRAKFVLLVMGLLAVGLIVTLWLSTAAAADSYRLQDARVAARALSEQSEQLRREVMAMDAAPALAQQAAALGMVPVQDSARLVVGPDGAVTLVGTPKAAIATAPPAPLAPAAAPNGAPSTGTAPNGAAPNATAAPNGTDPNTPTEDAAAAAGAPVTTAGTPTPAPNSTPRGATSAPATPTAASSRTASPAATAANAAGGGARTTAATATATPKPTPKPTAAARTSGPAAGTRL
jgi:cell division protein FtsI (penicillin-binding protein 3)